MALNGLFCADVPLRNYSLTHFVDYICHSGTKDDWDLSILKLWNMLQPTTRFVSCSVN